MTKDDLVGEILKELRGFVSDRKSGSPANYVRNFVCTKLPYLEAFVEKKSFPPFELEIQISSHCNLNCKWCIGAEVQTRRNVLRLSDLLNTDGITRIVNDILTFRENDLGIELVKFSGFIGEPLLPKHMKTTLHAVRQLVGAGKKVGIFTNGVWMTEDTWPTLANVFYVNVSLDAGPSSYYWLKESNSSFSDESFSKVTENIKGLKTTRDKMGTSANITVSYVMVPGNHNEIFETARLVKEAGADGIRFKCDIGGTHELKGKYRTEAFAQLNRAKRDLEDSAFLVTIIHSETDIDDKTYLKWQCRDGCFYQLFVATIGSDGSVYLCDHNTMPGAIPLGSAVNESLESIWRNPRREYLLKGIPYICQCQIDPAQTNPCPSFGNAANFFLKRLRELADSKGEENAIQALRELKAELESIAP